MNGRHILVVEDNEMVAFSLREQLVKLGYQIDATVRSGVDALQQVQTIPPDLILMDISLMGEFDGITAAEKILALVDLPIIYLTAHPEKQFIDRAKDTYPYGFLSKPVKLADLEASLEIALYRHTAEMKIKDLNRQLQQEIFERKQIEEKLKKNEELLETIIEESPEFISVNDLEGNYILANQQFIKYTQLETKELVLGRKAHDFFSSGTADHLVEMDQEIIKTQKTIVKEGSFSTDFGAKPGSEAQFLSESTPHFIYSKFPIRNSEEKMIAIGCMGTDITRLKEAQAQLIQSTKLASLGELSTGVGHELKQPLNIICLLAGHALECLNLGNQDLTQEDLKKILRQVHRASKIVSQLKLFARDSRELQYRKMDFNEIILDSLILIHDQFKAETIEVQQVLGKKLPTLSCNSIQIEQVLTNLFLNAKDAMANAKEKKITVSSFQEDGFLCVEVKDTGHGMSKQTQEKVFDSFFTTKEVGEGTGLGLSISLDIIKSHGGEMEVRSTLGEGCSFLIKFPIHK